MKKRFDQLALGDAFRFADDGNVWTKTAGDYRKPEEKRSYPENALCSSLPRAINQAYVEPDQEVIV